MNLCGWRLTKIYVYTFEHDINLFIVVHSCEGPFPIFQNQWDFSWQASKMYNVAK